MKKVYLKRFMLIKLAKRYIIQSEGFLVCGKVIPMTQLDVSRIMGLPMQGYDVNIRTQAKMNKDLFNKYNTDGNISLKTLENLIATSTTPDDDFIRQFVLFTIGIILAPTANDYVDPKYLAVVDSVEDISKFNWAQFTLIHLLGSIENFLKVEQVTLQGNLALLQVC